MTKHTNDDLAEGGPTVKIEVEGDDNITNKKSNGCKVVTDDSESRIKKEPSDDYDEIEEGEVDITDMIEEVNDFKDDSDAWSSGDEESMNIEIKEDWLADVYYPEVVLSKSWLLVIMTWLCLRLKKLRLGQWYFYTIINNIIVI